MQNRKPLHYISILLLGQTLALLIQTAVVYTNMGGMDDNLPPIYSNAWVHKFSKNQAATSKFS